MFYSTLRLISIINILSVFTFASSQIDVEADGIDVHAAHNIIREQGYIKHTINSEVQSTVTCTFSDTEDCNLGDMTVDESVVVQPGGLTRCIYSTSGPFQFQVIKGDSDKVLYYYQGGGACWDETVSISLYV
jgi:hypothetical protein